MRCYLFYLTGGSLCPVRTSSIGSSTFFFFCFALSIQVLVVSIIFDLYRVL